METKKVKFLQGKLVYLRPITADDLPQLMVWFNDPELRGLTGEIFPTDPRGMEEFLERIHNDKERVWFAVVLQENDRLVGETGLLRMFPAWRTTDLSIILGDPEAWGKGYGREVMELMLDYAFGTLNFHRVAIGVVGTNERALKFYERIGFKREGIQRDGYFFDHHYQDFVMMSLLEEEYRADRAS
jgi:RimJ/RimL family protein N-acetyltransferase